MNIFTIGYQHCESVEKLTDILKNYDVNLLLDVRSYTTSHKKPQYSLRSLQSHSAVRGIQYAWGKELGGFPKDKSLLTNGKPDYEKMARSRVFQRGMHLLGGDISQGRTVALLCMEHDPDTCHRKLLVTNVLKTTTNISITHLNGSNGLIF